MVERVALVTGAARGIGHAIGRRLATDGFTVAAADIDAMDPADFGPKGTCYSFDLSKDDEIRRLVKQVHDAHATVDCLVLNAGVGHARDILDLEVADLDRVLATNFRGGFLLAQAVAKAMVARPATRCRSIVFITSVNASAIAVDRFAYTVSKAALSVLSRTLAARLAQYGISVFEVRPGIIRTDMTAPRSTEHEARIARDVPAARWGTVDDVASAVALLVNPSVAFATGSILAVDGGLSVHRM